MEEGEEEEWEELEEEDELNTQQQQEEDEMGARFRNYSLHVVSREKGMNAIFNVPQQLQSSSSLLYLGNRCFCYVMTGMPPQPKCGSDYAIEDDKVRVISIVIFQVLGQTYKEGAIRLFRAKFLYSAHYSVKTPFPNEGIIHGCFSLGRVFDTAKEQLCTTQFQDPVSHTPMSMLVRQAQESQQTQIEAAADLQGWLRSSYTQAMDIFQLQLQADQSRNPFGTQKLGSNVHVAAGRDHTEASARSRSIGGGEFPVPPIDVSDSGTGNSSSQRQRRRRDDGERRTLTVPVMVRVPRIGNTEIPPEDGFTWRKYGQKEILGSKYPRGYYRCTHRHLKGCLATKQLQRMDDDPNTFEVTYRGSHTCHMSSTGLSIGLPPSSVADQISPEVTQLSMDSLGSGSLMTVGPLPLVADQISSDVTQLSMDSLGRGSFMAVDSGSSGVDLSTAQNGKEVEHPVADMVDEMFYSDNSSSSSMDFLFQPPEDDK